MKYRKKPVVIEAIQWDGTESGIQRIKAKFPALETLAKTGHLKRDEVTRWRIGTLEGGHDVSKGDFIIKGIKGEHYPCKPDIFAATYEEVIVMTEKPEALRLAECLDEPLYTTHNQMKQAAAELRRLHKENELLASAADKIRLFWRNEVHRLITQRDALLEALKQSLEEAIYPSKMLSDVYEKARAAIKAVEGE